MSYLNGKILENRYQIEDILGQGGMGAVYQGFDTKLKIPVALKENFLRTPESITQFEQEGLLLARLRHPNLPRVIDHFTYEEKQYLVMDFIEGQNLWDIIKTQGHPLTPEQALHYITQINQAVQYLHEQDPAIIHRDIKPHNIKITSKGEAILVDFGIAKIDEPHSNTSSAARSVTPGYSSPEQYSGSGTTLVSDVYSLGATLWAILTGQQPPDSIHLITGKATLTFPPTLQGHLPLELQQAIQHAMQPRPEHRPQSVKSWQAELDMVNKDQTVPLPSDNAPTVKSGPRQITPPSIPVAPPRPAQPITKPMPVILPPPPAPMPAASNGSTLWKGIALVALMIAVGALAFVIGSNSFKPPEVDTQAILRALAATATAQVTSGNKSNVNIEQTLVALAVVVTQQAMTQEAKLDPTATPLPATATATTTSAPTVTPVPSASDTPTVTITPTIPVIMTLPTATPKSNRGKIAFFSGRTGNGDLYLMNPDGTNLVNLTSDNFGIDQDPALSFDGQSIVFNSFRNNLASLYFMKLDGSGLTQLIDKNYRRPAWSPNGQEIIFDIGSRLDVAYTDQRVGRVLAQVSGDSHPDWSPDGTRIVYETEDSANNVELFIINEDSTGLINITNSPGINERYPAWSPDGTQIAFVSDNGSGGDDIYRMNIDKTNVTRLTLTPAGQQWANRHPTWSPDGTKIAFTSRRDGNDEIYIMNALDGNGLTNLTNNPADDNNPSWKAMKN